MDTNRGRQMNEERLKKLWKLGPQFMQGTPHGKFLGLKFVAVDKEGATVSLPYQKKLIGNAKTKVMHGGAITALLDQASGLAALAAFPDGLSVATLDLRIDYMRAANPGKTVIAEARAYKTTKHITFIRGIAHDGDANDPVATSQASFMTTAMGRKETIDPEKREQAVEKLAKSRSRNRKGDRT